MSNTFKSIDDTLNTSFVRQDSEVLIPAPKEEKKTVAAVVAIKKEFNMTVSETKENINNNFAEDYELIRETLRDLITSGKEALTTAKDLAEATESPRAYEVCSSIITTIVGIGKELTNLHKDAIKIADSNNPNPDIPVLPATGSITQNNYFQGTTKELQAVLDDVVEVKYEDDD